MQSLLIKTVGTNVTLGPQYMWQTRECSAQALHLTGLYPEIGCYTEKTKGKDSQKALQLEML